MGSSPYTRARYLLPLLLALRLPISFWASFFLSTINDRPPSYNDLKFCQFNYKTLHFKRALYMKACVALFRTMVENFGTTQINALKAHLRVSYSRTCAILSVAQSICSLFMIRGGARRIIWSRLSLTKTPSFSSFSHKGRALP